MAEYDNRNSGVLFKNDRKETDRQPDYTGSWTDGDGNEFWLSAWIKEGKRGKFMSLSAKPKQNREAQAGGQGKPVYDEPDDAPF